METIRKTAYDFDKSKYLGFWYKFLYKREERDIIFVNVLVQKSFVNGMPKHWTLHKIAHFVVAILFFQTYKGAGRDL